MPAPETPSSKDIEAELDAARADLTKREDGYADTAYGHSIGKVDADSLAAARGAVRAATDRVADLERAVERAKAVEAQKLLEAKRAAKEASLRSLRQHVGRRDRLAAELEAAVKALVSAWEALNEQSEKITKVVPPACLGPGVDMPLLKMESLKGLVEVMTYKASAPWAIERNQTSPGLLMMEGARCGDMRLAGLPDRLPSITDRMKGASEWLIRTFTLADDVTVAEPEKPKKLPAVPKEDLGMNPDPNAPRRVVAEPAPLKHAPIDTPQGRREFASMAAILPKEERASVLKAVGAVDPLDELLKGM
jgi:hypothetical protein